MIQTLNKPRLLFITSDLVAGGASLLTLNWIDALLDEYEIDLLVCGKCDAQMLSRIPSQVRLYTFYKQKYRPFLFKKSKIIPISAFSDLLSAYHPNLINHRYHALIGTSVFWKRNACLAFLTLKAKTKICFLLDECLLLNHGQPHSDLINLVLEEVSHFISVSKGLWQRVQNRLPIHAKLADVMWPPIASPSIRDASFYLAPMREPLLLTVARLDMNKGILESVRLHAELKKMGLLFKWYVLGVGPYEKEIRTEIEKLGLQDDFILFGYVENVMDWLERADLFVLLSKSEGCPTVVLEALEAGTPVLATDVCGIREILDNGRFGRIVSHEFEEIKKSLAQLIIHPELRDNFKNVIKSGNRLAYVRQNQLRMKSILQEETVTDGSHQPSVTILISTYNQGEFLEKAIESALSQDYPNLEVVVVDDASIDDTPSICKKWQCNTNFRYVRNSKNLGRVDNYAKSIANDANGDWVLMLDGDDYLEDTCFITYALNLLTQHPCKSIAFIQAGQCDFDMNRGSKKNIRAPIAQDHQIMYPGMYLEFVMRTGFFSHLGILFRRDIALKHGAYSKNISASDMETFLKISLDHPVIVTDRIAGVWRKHGANHSLNIPLEHVPENLIFINELADESISRNISAKHALLKSVRNYQAHTLIHLIQMQLKSSNIPMSHILSIYRIVWLIQKRLMLNIIFQVKLIKMILKVLSKKYFRGRKVLHET